MRIRTIRKVGNSWFIKLDPSDVKDFDLEIGDEYDVELCLIQGRKEE
jgi:antitoxin component of MazEF toxin-antitoxin module